MRKNKKEKLPFISVVLPAAGSSRRMGDNCNKLLLPLGEIPVLIRTLFCFERNSNISEIIISCREQDIIDYAAICKQFSIKKVSQIVRGGDTRTESVWCGVKVCSDEADYIAVHDAARPLLTQDTLNRVIYDAIEYGAAAPVVPLKDSIKHMENGFITGDVPRDSISAVQTPQIFEKDILKKALYKALQKNITLTDDCGAVEIMGVSVFASIGDYKNIKITTAEDMLIAETFLQEMEEI